MHFSKAWKAGEKDDAKDYLGTSYFMSLFIVLPAMCALIVLDDEMINVIFERGKFTSFSTEQTAKALKWYALGLPFYSFYKIFVPSFYAIDRQVIPVYASVGSILFNIIFCVSLVPHYGYEVLAIGTSLSMLINSTFQAVILKKDIGLEWTYYFNLRVIKLLISFGLVFYSTYLIKTNIDFFNVDFFDRCLYLAGMLSYIASSYFLLVFIFGERSLVLNFLKRFKRNRTPS